MSVKDFFAAVGGFLSAVIAGIISFFVFDKIKKKNLEEKNTPEKIDEESEKAKEEKKNEIENINSADLVKQSDNYEDIQSGIEKLQTDSTERIRNRLKEKL